MKIQSIQPNNIQNFSKRHTTNKAASITFLSDEQQKTPKKESKVKSFLCDVCIGWVLWDIIKEIYHAFSNSGKPPFP